jgi:hypothetical protein
VEVEEAWELPFGRETGVSGERHRGKGTTLGRGALFCQIGFGSTSEPIRAVSVTARRTRRGFGKTGCDVRHRSAELLVNSQVVRLPLKQFAKDRGSLLAACQRLIGLFQGTQAAARQDWSRNNFPNPRFGSLTGWGIRKAGRQDFGFLFSCLPYSGNRISGSCFQHNPK